MLEERERATRLTAALSGLVAYTPVEVARLLALLNDERASVRLAALDLLNNRHVDQEARSAHLKRLREDSAERIRENRRPDGRLAAARRRGAAVTTSP